MRPPRYYDQDFMDQSRGRINGVPLYFSISVWEGETSI